MNNYNINIQKASGLSKEQFSRLTAGQKLEILRKIYLYIDKSKYNYKAIL